MKQTTVGTTGSNAGGVHVRPLFLLRQERRSRKLRSLLRSSSQEQAVEICNLTHFWQPDCTLVLMHSAIGSLIAAEALWQLTFNQPYPNVVKSNLGREKIERYNAIPRPSVFDWFMGDQEDTLGIGHFMAWVSFQNNWVRQLKAQVEAVLGENPPMRILVVDDLHMEGETRLLVLSLLKHLYPQARVIFSTHRVSSS